MSIKGIDNKIVKGKVAIINKANYIIDIKAKIIIIRYYRQEALFKIFYL
jgi:hypothetical protein